MSETNIYQLHLPCFKQGDDLATAMDNHPDDLAAAFEEQAEYYKRCAGMCKKMAMLAEKCPGLSVFADTHMISIQSESEEEIKDLDMFVMDGYLEREEIEDE